MGLLDGKVMIVTGAGGGIGREHALALARDGAAVVVNDLGGARDGTGSGNTMADQVAEEIRAAGGEATASYDDVSSIAGGEAILQAGLDAFDKVDGVVNNAGILRDKSFANTTEDLWDIVVNVHLRGTYCVSQAVYKHLKERNEGGVIINTSSTSGLNGNFGQCNYGPQRRASRACPAAWPSRARNTACASSSWRRSRSRASPTIFPASTWKR